MSTINHNDPDVREVAAALADACHAGGLSDGYYRTADDALARLAAKVDRLEAERDETRDELGQLKPDRAEVTDWDNMLATVEAHLAEIDVPHEGQEEQLRDLFDFVGALIEDRRRAEEPADHPSESES